jgi:RHS repeat-associated protein
MVMPGRIFQSDKSVYGFNGMRKDNELYGEGKAYDFGGRIFNPRIVRWFSVDPKSQKYPTWSPYNFGIDNPTNVIDPDGEEIILLIWATKSKDAGHTAIAIRDYKTERVKVRGRWTTVHKALDTYTVYELGPAQRDLTGDQKHAATTDRLANYEPIYDVTKGQIIANKNKDGKQVSKYDKNQADGIIQFGNSGDEDFETDEKARNALSVKSEAGRAYNGVTNNCSSYCSDVIPTSEGEKVNATETVNTVVKTYKIITPNKLYTEAEKLKKAIILKKAPTEIVSKGFINAYTTPPAPNTNAKSGEGKKD